MKTVVTSALPYANGSIHIGHLVEYIQTDIFVRFLKLIGKDVIYCCADDTHGTPIQINAEKQGIKPEELIKRMYKEHITDFKAFGIEFDSYHSTNSPENQEYADLIYNKLNENGDIYTKDVEQYYCEHDKRFLPDRFVKGKCPKCKAEDQYGDVCEKCNSTYRPTDLIEPYCVLCKKKPIRKSSKHYFFKLTNYQDKLKKWLTDKKLQPEIKNYVLNWIKDGLKDWDISRDGPYFGFKIPGEKDKYYYVWLDAPIGYISSTANYCKNNDCNVDDYWKSGKVIHFIGKDIIYFHFLFWPAMLMGSGFKLPDDIVVHGFLTVNGEKMSKSRGTFFTAKQYLQEYEPEHLRWFYAKELSKKMQDINLNFNEFTASINNELAANIGNFCYRIISFTNKNFDGKIKDTDGKILKEIVEKVKIIKENYENVNLKAVVKNILSISSIGNKYFQDNEPWKTKDQKVLGTCINIAKILSILLKPIMPEFSSSLEGQLNVKDLRWDDIGKHLTNHKIGKEEILVERIEPKTEFPLTLKVGKIKEVDDHPDADKLYVIKVDIGEERKLCAGLKKYYSKEKLVGKKVVVVANMKPAKLRGVESNGMLLAAEKGEKVVLLSSDSDIGIEIKIEGYTNSSSSVDYKQFSKVKFKVKDKKVYFEDKEIAVVDIDDGAEVC